MNIELKEQSLFDAIGKYKNRKPIVFNEVNNRIEQLLHGAESCRKMIENRRKISNEDFYNMLNEFAFISGWNDYDCCNVLEMVYKTKFVNKTIINTTMYSTNKIIKRHGKDFSCLDEEVGISFKILYTKDFDVDYEHSYTIKEIEELISEKKIVILSELERNLTLNENNYKKEKYQRFECAYNDYNMKYEFLNKKGKYYKYTLKYIKKELNTRELKNLFLRYLNHIESEIYDASNGSNYGSDYWSQVAKKYSKEFEDKGYAKRLIKLNDFK